MPPLPPTPAELPEELVEQILLRFSPKDPAALVRAALVCKPWRRLVSGAGFRRRFREFHRTPPMLGMFCNQESTRVSHFVPTTAFRPPRAERGYGIAVDARHGRVLLRGEGMALGSALRRGEDMALTVWDPITDDKWKVPLPPECVGATIWTAAVLCSAAAGTGGCDHLDCHRQPFTVVFVTSVRTGHDGVMAIGMGPEAVLTSIYTYSSNAAGWSEPTWSQRPDDFVHPFVRSALVGNTLYFGIMSTSSLALKYNMQLRQMSWIQLPSPWPCRSLCVLTTTEDGGLRFAIQCEYKLYIWSTKDADEVDTRWEQIRVIDLNTLLPDDADLSRLYVVGSTDGLGTIFMSDPVDNVVYAIDLKTFKVKKVYEYVGTINAIVPYAGFYTPGTGEGPSAGGSSA